MMDFLYPLKQFHPYRRMIKNKYQSDISLRHLRILGRVKDDWLHDSYEVVGGNPLIKILTNLNAITEDNYRAYLMVREQVGALAGALGFFNGTDKGRLLDKPYFFMDENIPEAIVSVIRDESHELILEQVMHEDKNYWMSWEPIRIRHHCYTDMDYWIMCKQYDGEKRVPFDKTGINIIEIDIALLYMQYRYWYKSKYSHYIGEDDLTYRLPMSLFLTRFPLANAIDSQMQRAFINRVSCYFQGKELGSSRPISKRHAYINTYMNIDNAILYHLKHFKKYGGLNFDKIVSNLPTLLGNNYEDFYKPIEMHIDTRTELLSCYAALPLYEIWLSLIKELQQQRWNKNELINVSRGLFLMNNRKVFDTVSHRYGPRFQLRFEALAKLLP